MMLFNTWVRQFLRFFNTRIPQKQSNFQIKNANANQSIARTQNPKCPIGTFHWIIDVSNLNGRGGSSDGCIHYRLLDRRELEGDASLVASGRRSSFTNEDVLSEFLENSLKVPDLILPDRIFPRQKTLQNPPKLDFECLASLDNESNSKFIDSVSRTGCFEVFNHGVPLDLIKSALAAGAGIFRISPEKRKAGIRSLERPYGFEEFHGDEEKEKEINEEFVWLLSSLTLFFHWGAKR